MGTFDMIFRIAAGFGGVGFAILSVINEYKGHTVKANHYLGWAIMLFLVSRL